MIDIHITPRFSIVTVVLNPVRSDLWRTINSVFKQTFVDWELVIKIASNGGESLDEFLIDDRVRIVSLPDDGIYDAMNQSVSYCNGDYICFLNCGDTFFNNNVLNSINALKSSDVDFFYGHARKKYSKVGFEFYPSRLSPFFLFTNTICHQCWFVRKSYYQSRLFNIKYVCEADYDLLLNMILVDKLKYELVDTVFVDYQGGGISSTQKSLERQSHFIQIQMSYFNKYYYLFKLMSKIRFVFIKMGNIALFRYFYKLYYGH